MTSKDLLSDDDIRRWYENLARGSELTADKNLRLLARFCRLNETSPGRIIEEYRADKKGFVDRLMDFIETQRNGVGNGGKQRAASYLREYLVVLSSWLRHHGEDPPRGIKVGDTRATPTLREERIPTKEELRAILHRARPRARAIIALMAFSGLRPQVLGTGRGTDGLRIRHLRDFDVRGGTVTVPGTPARIDVPRQLSKAGHAYFTFLSEEGCDIVKAYLQSRVDRGEQLDAESAVIRVTPGYESKGRGAESRNRHSQFLVTGNLGREVRDAFGEGFKQRPYVLRSYFDTNLLYSEAKEGVPRDFRVFWMGHVGDIEHRYTTHKVLPPEMIETMRDAYTKAEPFLSTVSFTMEVKPRRVEVLETDLAELVERLVEEKLRERLEAV